MPLALNRACMPPTVLQRRPLCRGPKLLPHGPLVYRRYAAFSDADTARVTVDDTDAMSAEGSETIIAETEPVTAAATEAAVPSHPLTDMFGAQELMSELQDENQFGKRGEAWTVGELAVMVLVLLPPFTLTGLVDILATLLITAGVVFMIYGLLSLGCFFSPLAAPRARHELVTSGMYSYVRHPMDGGLLMAAFGLAVITRNETRLALAALLWFLLEKKAALEEKLLLERYGQLYEDYKAKIKKRFFPLVY